MTEIGPVPVAQHNPRRPKRPRPAPAPGDGFEHRAVRVGVTFGGAAVLHGSLTPECASAVRAVLESLGKKAGPEDDRTEEKRFHDALQQDGGETSVSNCVLLCQYHHDVCIHRNGWQLTLHPDGTTEARSPDGTRVLHSHTPPSTSKAA